MYEKSYKTTDSNARPRTFYAVTEIPCPVCNAGGFREGRFFGVIGLNEHTATLECMNCGNHHSMPRSALSPQVIEEVQSQLDLIRAERAGRKNAHHT